MQEQPKRIIVNDERGLSQFLTRVYGFMTLGVAVSAIVAYLVLTVYRASFFNFVATHSWITWLLMIVELGLVMGTSFKASRGGTVSFLLFMAYAVINGLFFALIAAVYTGATITTAFVAAAATFAGMALYGTFTRRNLSGIGQMAFAALIGLLVATIVNLFLQNPMVDYVFSFIGVLIFTGLTAWDSQRIKQMYFQHGQQTSTSGLAVMGALQLYMDFINLFLYFLRIFGVGGSDNN